MLNINTHFILPHPILKPYVKHFAVRKFDTDGIAFPKVITVENEMMISFHLHCRVYKFEEFDKGKPSPYVVNNNCTADCCFSRLQTSTKGFVVYKGQTTLLNIQFTPVGFFSFLISVQENF